MIIFDLSDIIAIIIFTLGIIIAMFVMIRDNIKLIKAEKIRVKEEENKLKKEIYEHIKNIETFNNEYYHTIIDRFQKDSDKSSDK